MGSSGAGRRIHQGAGGSGVFESEPSGSIDISGGNILVLFPGVWHHYRPRPETGWDEYWVECEGAAIESAVKRTGLDPDRPVINVGHDDAFLRCFLDILEIVEMEPPGFEPVIGLRSLEIVARISSLRMIAAEKGVSRRKGLVRQAILRMRENLG